MIFAKPFRGLGIALTFALISQVGIASTTVSGVIEKNVDGDTVWVKTKGENGIEKRTRLKIRMQLIDAPESHLPTSSGPVAQGEWGDWAAGELAKLTPVGTKVTV